MSQATNIQALKAANPFQQQGKSMAQATSLVEVESQRAIQEVQAAMVIAKKFPRNQIDSMDRILTACTRTTLAEGALYSYSRGGSDITGPSIRLAETIAQMWGNIQFGIKELSQANGESTVEAFAWDIETNTRQVKVFQVPHIRYSKSGSKKLEDPRDIYEAVANQGARRLRACILGVIPGDVIESAVNQCEVTLKASADTSPEAIKKIIEAFDAFGVSQQMLEKKIQKRMESINAAQVITLRKIYTSMRDGMSKAADWFEIGTAITAADLKKPEPKKAAAPVENVDTASGEITREEQPALGLNDAIAAARNGDVETAQDISRELNERDRAEVEKHIQQAAPVEQQQYAPRQRAARNLNIE